MLIIFIENLITTEKKNVKVIKNKNDVQQFSVVTLTARILSAVCSMRQMRGKYRTYWVVYVCISSLFQFRNGWLAEW